MSNTPDALRKFFETPEKPIKVREFMEFWSSLTEEEKDYYRKVELS